MLLKFIKKWQWQVYVIIAFVLSMVLSRLLLDRWMGGRYIFMGLVVGLPCIWAGFVKWDDDAKREQGGRSRLELAIRIVIVLFGAFLIVGGVMAVREDVLARKELGKQALPSLQSPADMVSPPPVQKGNVPKN